MLLLYSLLAFLLLLLSLLLLLLSLLLLFKAHLAQEQTLFVVTVLSSMVKIYHYNKILCLLKSLLNIKATSLLVK